MPIAYCGIQFSWDTPVWCKGGGEKCDNCPLNEKFNKQTVLTNEDDYDYGRLRKF